MNQTVIDDLRREMAREVFTSPRHQSVAIARAYAERIQCLLATREPKRPLFPTSFKFAGAWYILSGVSSRGEATYKHIDEVTTDIDALISYAQDEETNYLANYPVDTEFGHLNL